MLSTSSKAIWDTMAKASRAHGEHNDCTVKALTAATGRTYDDCHKALAKQGRKNRRGCNFHTVGTRAAKDLGFLMETVDWRDYDAKTCISAERDRKLAKGKFVLQVRGHVAAMVDGKVIDWTEGRRHRIRAVYAFTPIAAKPEPKAPKAPKGTETWRSFRKYTKRDNLELF